MAAPHLNTAIDLHLSKMNQNSSDFLVFVVIAFLHKNYHRLDFILKVLQQIQEPGINEDKINKIFENISLSPLGVSISQLNSNNYNINNSHQETIQNWFKSKGVEKYRDFLKRFWTSFNGNCWNGFETTEQILVWWLSTSGTMGTRELNEIRRAAIPELFNRLTILKYYNYNPQSPITLGAADTIVVELNNNAKQLKLESRGLVDTLGIFQLTNRVPQTGSSIYTQVSQRPLGFAIIFNFINYSEKRQGAEKDGYNLLSLLEQLGYTVVLVQDVMSRDDLFTQLRNFKEMLKGNIGRIGSVLVIFDGHGCSEMIFCGNGEFISHAELIDEFHSTRRYFRQVNKELRGIPKIFVFQCCRGRTVMTSSEVQNVRLAEIVEDHTWKDTIICYATPDGFASYLSPTFGSFYIYFLIKVIRQNAHQWDLTQILTQAGNDTINFWKNSNYPSPKQPYQVPTFCRYGFDKKFYFNTALTI